MANFLNPMAGLLSPDEQSAVQGNSLLQLGGNLLAGSGWQPHPVTFGSILGQAALPALQAQQQMTGQMLHGKVMKTQLEQSNMALEIAKRNQAINEAIMQPYLQQLGMAPTPPQYVPGNGMPPYAPQAPQAGPSVAGDAPQVSPYLVAGWGTGNPVLTGIGQIQQKNMEPRTVGNNLVQKGPDGQFHLAPGFMDVIRQTNYAGSPAEDLAAAQYHDKTGNYPPGYVTPELRGQPASPNAAPSPAPRPVPGISPEQQRAIAAKRAEDQPKDLNSMEDIFSKSDAAIDAAKAVLKEPGLNMATGKTYLLGKVPGTQAYDAAQKLEVLKSQVMLSVLQSFRAASANGSSGFGQLSNTEGDTLRNSIANLNAAQTLPALKSALNNVVNSMQASKDRMRRGYKRLYGEEPQIKEYHTNPSAPDSSGIKFLGFE